MRFARFSIADLLAAVGLCAVSLACLINASTPWASAVLSVTLAALVLSVIGVIYRRGERRAFWAGFAICGWAYMTLSSGPWFNTSLRYQLVTAKLLDWAYPLLIPAARQSSNPNNAPRRFVVPAASVEGDLTVEELRGSRVDVWVEAEGDKAPSLLVEGVPAGAARAAGAMIARTTLMVDRDQFAKLSQAKADSRQFILRRYSPSPFTPLWSSPPVQLSDFAIVGHALFGILCAWSGSIVTRYFYATRERAP